MIVLKKSCIIATLFCLCESYIGYGYREGAVIIIFSLIQAGFFLKRGGVMLDNFLDTSETIGTGLGFPLFGVIHLSWLLVISVACVLTVYFYRRMQTSRQKKFLIVIALLLLVIEIVKIFLLIITEKFEWDYLPLHLCSINIFVILSHSIKPTKFTAEFLYAVCLPGAAAALLFPGWPTLPLLNFLHIHSFIAHTLLLLYPLLLLGGGFKPDYRQLPKCLLLLITLSPILYALNKILVTNFMFLNHPGTDNPLALFEEWLGNPGYIVGFFVLLAIVWAFLYIPAVIKETTKQRESKG